MVDEGAIVLIDDDLDDLDFMTNALKALGIKNEIKCFDESPSALAFLKNENTSTFIILCDVNMPLLDGFQLRREIHEDKRLSLRSIPFLFISTSYSEKEIEKAYSLSVQGYFRKPTEFGQIKELMKCIVRYWGEFCLRPRLLN